MKIFDFGQIQLRQHHESSTWRIGIKLSCDHEDFIPMLVFHLLSVRKKDSMIQL